MSDAELLQLYADDPKRAVGITAQQYSAYVYAIVRDKLSGYSEEDVEETVNDVFIRFWHDSGKVDLKRGSIKAYICVLAKSLALNRREKLSHRSAELPLGEAADVADNDTPERKLARRELLYKVSRLNDTDRKAVVMRYYYAMPHAEIAAQLGISETAVRKRISRTLKKLGEEMEGWL